MTRCAWVDLKSEIYVDYHDHEWGVPEHDDQALFEKLILDGAQAGLSWITILKKRDGYRRAFDGFDAARIASYDEGKVEELLADPGIVRNRLKVAAAIGNARAYLEIQASLGSFAGFLWDFVDGAPIQNAWRNHGEVPVSTPQSDAMSRELQRRGFKFVGTTICYAFMQAVGMVNDHTVDCFRHAELSER
ncbi:MAG: DNA-3-methyladenine glycosylase I [Gammaproteobacteria bacterium]|nr:DNA-3-methyladenine glycosylase I [Gammaproteobacteria bacterium]